MAHSVEKVLDDEQVSLNVLKVIADNSFDSILITDATKAGKIIYANKAFKALTGFDPDSVVGKTPRILQGPATDKKVLVRLAKTLQEGRRFEGRAINYRKDGTPFIMQWRVVPAKVGSKIKAWLAIQREASSA
jgi:PAS domain S-box-containing protein